MAGRRGRHGAASAPIPSLRSSPAWVCRAGDEGLGEGEAGSHFRLPVLWARRAMPSPTTGFRVPPRARKDAPMVFSKTEFVTIAAPS
ncbi:MAG: hypothetical protein H0U65_05220 [Rubrobacter sp.]|nr:hypothetical protein [Rubrobacter sp.]